MPPDIRDKLEGLHCKFFSNFNPAFSYLTLCLRVAPD
jgi:hypothetical protein